MRCVEACPAGALSGSGRFDKRKCGNRIFSGGFREWRRFLLDLLGARPERREEIAESRTPLDFWQIFMTGNYSARASRRRRVLCA